MGSSNMAAESTTTSSSSSWTFVDVCRLLIYILNGITIGLLCVLAVTHIRVFQEWPEMCDNVQHLDKHAVAEAAVDSVN